MARNAKLEERVDRQNRRLGEFIQRIADRATIEGLPEGRLTGFTVRLPTRDQPEAFLILKASSPQGGHVAFVGGLDLVQAILVWRAKELATGMKWREDVPYGQRAGV